MKDESKPSTIVRIKGATARQGGYRATYVLKNTILRSQEITSEGDHILVLVTRVAARLNVQATARGS